MSALNAESRQLSVDDKRRPALSPTFVEPSEIEKKPVPNLGATTTGSLRWILLTFTLLENLIFSGIVFGWPALVYMLKAEHIYEHLCYDQHHRIDLDDASSVANQTSILSFDNQTTTADGAPNVLRTEAEKFLHKLDCIEQENVLNQAYTIGIFMMGFTSFAWGFALESLGLRSVRALLNLLITVGCVLLLATNEDMDFLIQPAIILLGLIGVPLRIANMTIADYFPNHRSTIISIYSGAFSASPLVFVLCKHVYDRYGAYVSYVGVMSALFVLSLGMLPTTYLLLPYGDSRGIVANGWNRFVRNRKSKKSASNRTKIDDNEVDATVDRSNRNQDYRRQGLSLRDAEASLQFIDDEQQQQFSQPQQQQQIVTENNHQIILKREAEEEEPENRDFERQSMLPRSDNLRYFVVVDDDDLRGDHIRIVPSGALSRSQPIKNSSSSSSSSSSRRRSLSINNQEEEVDGAQNLASTCCGWFAAAASNDTVPLGISIYSFSFIAHMLWFSWLNTYMVLYSGSLVLWLARVTADRTLTSAIIQSFGLIQTTALLIAPLAGYLMDRQVARAKGASEDRQHLAQAMSAFVSMMITNLALSGAALARFVDTPAGVYVSIIFITLLRSFLIAVASAYIRVRFPQTHFSRLNGIMCTVGAFFSLLNSPLFYYERLDDYYAYHVNLFCGIISALSWIHPLTVGLPALQSRLLKIDARRLKRYLATERIDAKSTIHS